MRMTFGFTLAALTLLSAPLLHADEAMIARGEQIVNTGGCSGCHSPPDGPAWSGNLQAGWMAYNITSDPVAGIGDWTMDELVEYFRTGHVNGKAQAAGPMAVVITAITSKLGEEDRKALALYLKSIPPANPNGETRSRSAWGQPSDDVDRIRGEALETASSPDELDLGARLYLGNCASCHGTRGEGAPGGFYPSLVNNSAVGAPSAENLVNVILDGVYRELPDGQEFFMPAFRGTLTNEQVLSLASYVLKRFGQPGVEATIEQVRAER